MNIVVLVKQVPDTYAERTLTADDHTLNRGATDAVLDEIDERAVEAALRLREAGAGPGEQTEVTVVTMGPSRATEAVRKALSMGADRAVHLADDSLHGTDAPGTATVLARLIGTLDDVGLVLAGNESSDGGAGSVPAMIAELLGLPAMTHARELSVDGSTVTAHRETADGVAVLVADLPAVVSVNEKINEPRYPSFKSIIAAKKKQVSTLTLADIGIEPDEVGLSGARSAVTRSELTATKPAGERIVDNGDGGRRIAAFLAEQNLV